MKLVSYLKMSGYVFANFVPSIRPHWAVRRHIEDETTRHGAAAAGRLLDRRNGTERYLGGTVPVAHTTRFAEVGARFFTAPTLRRCNRKPAREVLYYSFVRLYSLPSRSTASARPDGRISSCGRPCVVTTVIAFESSSKSM